MATTTNNGWETPDDSDPFKQGAEAMRTLGSAIDTSVGTGLLAWQSYTPTLSGGWANGNGVWVARYAKLGKTVFLQAKFTVGSTTTKGTGCNVSLPVTAQSASFASGVGTSLVAGSTEYLVHASIRTTTTCQLNNFYMASTPNRAGVAQFTATAPATWATNDYFHFTLTYESA